jgi:NTE family protein
VRHKGKLLVDGGLVRNLPVDVARDMGADVIIAVDVGTKLAGKDELNSAISIVYQMSGLLTVSNTNIQVESLVDRDVLITPAIGDKISSSDFDKLDEAIPLGYAAAEAAQGQLSEYSLSESEYRAWRQQINNCVQGLPEVHFVSLDNRSRFSDKVILDMIKIKPGQPLDIEQLDKDLRQIYALGFIRQARYNIVQKNGLEGLEIIVRPDERGNQYIETGVDLAFSARGTAFNIRGGYLSTALDDRGSEFRAVAQVGESPGLVLDYFKHLDDRLRYSLEPSAYLIRRPLFIYDRGGDALGQIELDEWGGSILLGREFGRSVMLNAGFNRYVGNLRVTVGDPETEPFSFNGAEFFAGLRYDRLDNRFLPTRGAYSALHYTNSVEGLGADDAFEQLEFSFFGSRTFGLHNILYGLEYKISLSDTIPIYALYTGGGFMNMSGYEPSSLLGPNYGHALLGYRYQVAKSGLLPGYVGMTLEYGDARLDKKEVFTDGILNGSVYFGYQTPLGPIFLGIGWSEDRSAIYFIRLGAILGEQNLGRR